MKFDEKKANLKKMRAIRNALNMSQAQLAEAMDCSGQTIYNYESGRHPITRSILKTFKIATGMEDIPLTADEIATFKKEIYWEDFTINFSDVNHVDAFLHKLSRCSEWSFDTDLQILCDLVGAEYGYATNKKKEAVKLVDNLRKREHEFSDEHFYWYYRYLAKVEHLTWRYKSALAMYFKVEEFGKRLHIKTKLLDYLIGYCYAEMDYSIQAIYYLEKVEVRELYAYSIAIGVSIQRFLAISYSRTGRLKKAIDLLESCRGYILREKKNDRQLLGGVYLDIGVVYQSVGEYKKALENYNLAAPHFDKGSDAYLEFLCIKVSLLRTHCMNDEVIACLDEGLPMATRGTLWHEWLTAVRHSMNLDENSSIDYIEWTSIPSILACGKHLFAVELYNWLSIHCENICKYKPSLKYCQEATKIYKKLVEGDLSPC